MSKGHSVGSESRRNKETTVNTSVYLLEHANGLTSPVVTRLTSMRGVRRTNFVGINQLLFLWRLFL